MEAQRVEDHFVEQRHLWNFLRMPESARLQETHVYWVQAVVASSGKKCLHRARLSLVAADSEVVAGSVLEKAGYRQRTTTLSYGAISPSQQGTIRQRFLLVEGGLRVPRTDSGGQMTWTGRTRNEVFLAVGVELSNQSDPAMPSAIEVELDAVSGDDCSYRNP